MQTIKPHTVAFELDPRTGVLKAWYHIQGTDGTTKALALSWETDETPAIVEAIEGMRDALADALALTLMGVVDAYTDTPDTPEPVTDGAIKCTVCGKLHEKEGAPWDWWQRKGTSLYRCPEHPPAPDKRDAWDDLQPF